MAVLNIPVNELDKAGKDFVFALDQSWLDQAFGNTEIRGDASQGPGKVEVHAQLNGTEVLVHGRAKARVLMECGRCLKGLPVEVACDFAALFTPGEAPKRAGDEDEDEDDIDPEEPDREYFTGDQLAIDELVRDYLLLELPMQASCDLGWSCPNLDVPEHMRSAEGVSSGKGFGEGTIDPRLLPLKKLAKGEPEKE